MRDERTKLPTFVITWMDGVPSNLHKFWQKWSVSSRGRGRKQRRGKGKNRALGLDEGVYIG
jgi:hypothetical protein